MSDSRYVLSVVLRLLSVALVVSILFFTSTNSLFLLIVIMGQAHFALAYWYQREGGHLPQRKIVFLSLCLLAFTILAFLVSFSAFIFFTGIAFTMHSCMDEIRLFGAKFSLFTTLEILPAGIFLFGIFVEGYLMQNWFVGACLAASITLGLYFFLSVRFRRPPNAISRVFFVWVVLILLLYFSIQFAPENAVKVFFGCVLFHYLIWYFEYWFKLKSKPAMRMTYLWRVLFLNAGFAGLAVFLSFFGQTFLFGLFFTSIAFYVWTMLHVIASVRPQEMLSSIQRAE